MYISKIILSIFMSSIFFMSCKDKKKIEPELEEYFNYPQIKGLGFGGTGQTLEAYGAGTAGYIITGYSRDNPIARGYVTIYIFGGQIPNQDTVFLNDIEGYASLKDYKHSGNNYFTNIIENGRIIFTKRTNQKLEGIFEFTARQQYDSTLIHITNGKFAIIPTIK